MVRILKDHVRNPLGVIGLFITLVYAIAGWFFSEVILEFPSALQLILTLFIVFYPCILLWVFFIFVTQHHKKLYAPNDYRSDESFLRSEEHKSTSEKLRDYDPEFFPQKNLKENMSSKSHADKKGALQKVINVLGKEALAEDLAFKHYQAKYGEDSVRKEVFKELGIHGGWDIVVREANGLRLHVEVKLLSHKSHLKTIADQADKMSRFLRGDYLKDRDFILFLAVDGSGEITESIREEIQRIIENHKYDFKFEIHNFDTLLKTLL
jgi:hypothetical protein